MNPVPGTEKEGAEPALPIAACEGSVPDLADSLLTRVLDFCRLLSSAGLKITPGRIVDVFRSLELISLGQRSDFFLALRTNLAGSRSDEETFDQLFRAFWGNNRRKASTSVTRERAPEGGDRDASTLASQMRQFIQGSRGQYSTEEILRRGDLAEAWSYEPMEMAALFRELAKRLATRPSRRRRAARRGQGLDLRRSLRRSMRYGMDVVELARTARKIRKTRLALLYDVSGSMDTYNPFLLQLMLGLQKAFKNSRTAVFSTKMTEITQPLRRRSVQEALGEIAGLARHWSGGTNIGSCLRQFNCEILREGSSKSTISIIVSDGYDQGDPALVRREMEILRRRARAVLWINPLLGTQGYEPTAKAMAAALRYVDYFLPAHDVTSLRALCRTLGRV